jgi:hypothetical protein
MVFNKNNSINTTLNPWTITGYVEAEGNFLISVYSYNNRETRLMSFNIHIHSEDIAFLTTIKNFFNCGTISSVDKKGHVTYSVKKKENIINIIIPFFTNYPLRFTKHLDEKYLNGIIESNQENDSLITLDNNIDQNSYNIKTLYLKILIPKDLIKNNVVLAKFLQLPKRLESPNYKLLTANNYKLLIAGLHPAAPATAVAVFNYKLLTNGEDSTLNASAINNKLIKENKK